MRKSLSKRIRITKTGKIMRRAMAVDHFRTRRSKKNLRKKKGAWSIKSTLRKLT